MSRREPRAGCILVNLEGKLLVVHDVASNYWGFPKGGKKAHETHEQAAIRELHEETGKRLKENSFATSFTANKSKLFLTIGDFKKSCLVDYREIDNYDWVTLLELKQLNTSKFTRSFLAKIDNYLKNPVNVQVCGYLRPTNVCIG